MKKILLGLIAAGMMTSTAWGGSITLFSVQFSSNGGTVSGLTSGSTEVDFAGITYGPTACTGPDAGLCYSGPGTTTSGPLGANTKLTSGVVESFQVGPDLYYDTDGGTWSLTISPAGSTDIFTTGFYYKLSDKAGTLTPGRLNFSFPLVNNGTSNVNAGGISNPTPEPGSILLMSAGLAGLGLLARRRRK